jgi:hypothetical protein
MNTRNHILTGVAACAALVASALTIAWLIKSSELPQSRFIFYGALVLTRDRAILGPRPGGA